MNWGQIDPLPEKTTLKKSSLIRVKLSTDMNCLAGMVVTFFTALPRSSRIDSASVVLAFPWYIFVLPGISNQYAMAFLAGISSVSRSTCPKSFHLLIFMGRLIVSSLHLLYNFPLFILRSIIITSSTVFCGQRLFCELLSSSVPRFFIFYFFYILLSVFPQFCLR